jgi:hypothetical protein
MCDKLVFDLAQEVEGSPNIFVRKDWVNILDNQNQNYNNNQSILDTSQLSNSNKYMSYREAYFLIPMLITLTAPAQAVATFSPATNPCDYSIGLKNWFGQIIHSFTLDYNGTTIVQQTPFINMWNSFKLMTSLSWSDVETQGMTIGFYPDDPDTWLWSPTPVDNAGVYVANIRTGAGQGVCNNFINSLNTGVVNPAVSFNQFRSQTSNKGFVKRTQAINYDSCLGGDSTVLPYNNDTAQNVLSDLLTSSNASSLWKSHIFNKIDAAAVVGGQAGIMQIAVVGTIYLKHVHSFFNMCPLLKGVFMKMTMNLNNTSCTFSTRRTDDTTSVVVCSSVNNALGGVNPLMITSTKTFLSDCYTGVNPTEVLNRTRYNSGGFSLAVVNQTINYTLSLSVGARCLNQQQSNIGGVSEGPMSKSIYLYIPAYTFNPTFEQAYLSDPVKEIKYTDVYQYQVLNVAGGGNQQFNNLLTNGIANVKSVLILPFFSGSASSGSVNVAYGNNLPTVSMSRNTGFLTGYSVFQSPFDPAGTGPTSPLCHITNFNVQVSGQNAIYNLQKYSFEQFNNQLYGVNAVNGGQTDGLTSSLINRHAFDMNYCYYYVNIERMLPVEESVPKSIQIIGTNLSQKSVDLYCFIEYGNSISIDALTGARI